MADERKLEKTREPGIYKRGTRYVVTYRDPLGRPKKRMAGTLTEARHLKSQLRADVSRGEYRAQSKTTFADYAPRWIAGYRGRTSRGIGPDTLTDYRRVMGLDSDGQPTGEGAVRYFGRTRLTEIGAPELRGYADWVAARGVARGTVRLALAPVKALLATAHEDGLIRHNPAAGLRNLLPADVEREHDKVKALAPEELPKVLQAIDESSRLFFEFLAETGLRVGEAIELRWKDVDLGGRWASVDRRYYRGRVAPPKGRKARRVRLSTATSSRLWEHRKATRSGDEDLVFTSEQGRRLEPSNVMSRVLKPAAVEAGIGEWVIDKRARGGRRAESWVGFHTFRHTCATMLFRSGWNAAQVQRQLGHSDPGFTLRRYVHLLDEDLPEPTVLAGLPVVATASTIEKAEAAIG